MKKLTIIVPNTDFEKLNEFCDNLKPVLEKYEYNYIFLHEKNKPNEFKASDNYAFMQVAEGSSLSEQINVGFINLKSNAVIIADMHTENYVKYVQNLIENWENGAKIVRLKYVKKVQTFWDKVKNFFVKIKNAFCNAYFAMIGLSKDSHCYNTFQLFDKDVYDLIQSMPEKNSYLRNSKCLSNFAEAEITTDEKMELNNHKMVWDSNLITATVLGSLFVLSLIVGIIVSCVVSKKFTLTAVTLMFFFLVGFGGFAFYYFSKAYLKYKFNK